MQKPTLTNNRGYSLIELMVVIGVIAAIAAFSIPSFLSINDNYALSIATNRVAAMINRAKSESAASTGKYQGRIQYYEVRFDVDGSVNSNILKLTVPAGTKQTVSLTVGSGDCSDIVAPSASNNTIETYILPSNIQISEIFPAKANHSGDYILRFAFGKMGYNCGSADSPDIKSTDLSPNNNLWQLNGATATVAYIKLINTKNPANRSRYVTIDRFTSAVGTKGLK